jgi:hypothetical protein
VEERDEKTATDPEVAKGPKEGEIEAHKKKPLIKATDDGSQEDSDDVELHRNKRQMK